MKRDKTLYFKHPKAIVESSSVGGGTRIWPLAHVMKGARIGANCNIGELCYIETGAIIGDEVTVKNGISVWDGVIIEDRVFLGPNMVFTNDIIPRSRVKRKIVKTLVKEGATIGANATVLAGITIGEYAMIGAGSVVTRDVPSFAVSYGNPARFKGYVCECGLKLTARKNKAICKCKRKYKIDKKGCRNE